MDERQILAAFSFAPTNHFENSIPSEVSRTESYHSSNSRFKKPVTLSQNHSGSAVALSRSSEISESPCSAMKRPTFVFSGFVGIQAASLTHADYAESGLLIGIVRTSTLWSDVSI